MAHSDLSIRWKRSCILFPDLKTSKNCETTLTSQFWTSVFIVYSSHTFFLQNVNLWHKLSPCCRGRGRGHGNLPFPDCYLPVRDGFFVVVIFVVVVFLDLSLKSHPLCRNSKLALSDFLTKVRYKAARAARNSMCVKKMDVKPQVSTLNYVRLRWTIVLSQFLCSVAKGQIMTWQHAPNIVFL